MSDWSYPGESVAVDDTYQCKRKIREMLKELRGSGNSDIEPPKNGIKERKNFYSD